MKRKNPIIYIMSYSTEKTHQPKMTYRHNNSLKLEKLVKGIQSHKSNRSGTVGVSNKLGSLGAFSIDLWNDKRDIFVITEG